jgi:regulator of sigma E protease
MLSLLAPILVFGLVIFVHEFGHFLAAKAMGVYAPRFSIGFGPALLRFRRGETEYILALLPLGGYVRMASRLDEETAFLEGGSETNAKQSDDWDPEAMIPFGPKAVPEHRWFESKSLGARLLIMIAGVTMNMILAVVVLSVLAFSVGRLVVPTTVIGIVSTTPAVPALAALRVGDTVLAVDGSPVSTWNQVEQGVASGDGALDIKTQRGTVTIPATSTADRIAVLQALNYFVPAVIDSVVAGERAAAAGLLPGDSVVAIGGAPVASWTDLSTDVSAAAETPLRFDVIREGNRRSITVTPKSTTIPNASGGDSTVGRIGAAARDITQRESIGPLEAVRAGVKGSWAMSTTIVSFLRQLVVGEMSVKQLGGPIAITRASVSAAKTGPGDLFYLIALLSVNVAVLNLLPIPILDGGQILLNVIESAKGSPFSMRTREYILRFGLAAIGLLFIIVMFNDTRGAFSSIFNWVVR